MAPFPFSFLPVAYLIAALATVAINAFSGVAAIARPRPIMAVLAPTMDRCGIPRSWLVFPIGTLKVAGAAGLALGLLGVPLIGIAAAIGLVSYYACAIFAHLRAGDYSFSFGLAVGLFLPLAIATLSLDLARLMLGSDQA